MLRASKITVLKLALAFFEIAHSRTAQYANDAEFYFEHV